MSIGISDKSSIFNKSRSGNTNTHGKFKPDVRTFLKRWAAAGPTHHFALGIGHHAETVRKVADALGIEIEVIC